MSPCSLHLMGIIIATAVRHRLVSCANGLRHFTGCFIVFDLAVQSMQWLTHLQVGATQTS